MPIYAYACTNCDKQLDKLQKISEQKLRDCPACGKPNLERLLTAPNFRLSGSGWYETDFKKDNKKNLSNYNEKSDSEKPTTQDAKNTDAKPEKASSTEKKATSEAPKSSSTSNTKDN